MLKGFIGLVILALMALGIHLMQPVKKTVTYEEPAIVRRPSLSERDSILRGLKPITKAEVSAIQSRVTEDMKMYEFCQKAWSIAKK